MTTFNDPLPHDFHIRCAYMRLYRARMACDLYWPKDVFGPEIETLLGLSHAEVFGGGYRLTDAGHAFWLECIRVWDIGSQSAHTRTASALHVLQDGLWHPEKDIPNEADMRFNTWARFVRPTLMRSKSIEFDAAKTHIRITDEGRAALDLIKRRAS